MRVSAVLLVAALILLAPLPPALGQVGGIIGQAPARDTQRPRTGTARIAGRVVNAETGSPVRRATVRVSNLDGVNIGQQPGVMTDADGNFEFRNLPGGSYAVFATKSGYLSSQQTSASDPLGKTIKLGEGEAATGTLVTLQRAGAIGGRVLDEYGEPIANVSVQVWRRQSIQGVKRLVGAGSSNGGTNDLGQYRVFGLQPGTYYVSASARPEGGSDVEALDRSGYAPTYYPGTASVGEAQAIELVAGQDAAGIDFMLTVARMGRVSGTVIGASGQRTGNLGVSAQLVTSGGPMNSTYSSGGQVQQDGTFVLNNLPPGDYVLTARSYGGGRGGGQGEMEFGQARVHVVGDVTGVVLQMLQGSTLSGQVVYDGAASSRAGAQRVSIAATPADPYDNVGTGGASGQVQADGTFTIRGLFGERILRVGAPSGWMLKAIYVNGRDVTDAAIPFDGRESVTGAQVVLTDRVTHLSGTVSDEQGNAADSAYVMLVPADSSKPLFGGRYLRSTMARGGNPWKVDALPPGDYVAIALRSTQGLDTQDSDFLDRVRKTGTRFTVREGETKDVPLKVSTIPKG
ncbi:MAG: MSCRAMM family protein [Bacteroidales bacterium]